MPELFSDVIVQFEFKISFLRLATGFDILFSVEEVFIVVEHFSVLAERRALLRGGLTARPGRDLRVLYVFVEEVLSSKQHFVFFELFLCCFLVDHNWEENLRQEAIPVRRSMPERHHIVILAHAE